MLNLLLMVTLFRLPEDKSEKEGLYQTMMMLQPRITLDMREPSTSGVTSIVEEVADTNVVKQKRVKVLAPKVKRQAENVKCDICGKLISFKRNMPRHMAIYHNKESSCQSYECIQCQTDFSSQYHLDRHVASKNCVRNLNFECRKCKQKFVSSDKMAVHMKKNCPKKFMCASCFSFFKSKKEYEGHLSLHEP